MVLGEIRVCLLRAVEAVFLWRGGSFNGGRIGVGECDFGGRAVFACEVGVEAGDEGGEGGCEEYVSGRGSRCEWGSVVERLKTYLYSPGTVNVTKLDIVTVVWFVFRI